MGCGSRLRGSLVLALGIAWAGAVPAATVYLCRSYGGGEFWSSQHCHARQSVIVRMTTVPDGMPFEQQVDLARSALRESERLRQPPRPVPATPVVPAGHGAECATLAARLDAVNAQSRRINPALVQDRLNDERRGLQSRRDALGCR